MFDIVSDIIVGQMGTDRDLIKPETAIMEELGADSLDVVEMLALLEDETGIRIPDSEIENMTTVGDIVSYLEVYAD